MMDRPALQQLLADITTGRVDIVVVYEGQRYRALTVIAERITGAHWQRRLIARAAEIGKT
jgi:hypothetical protein